MTDSAYYDQFKTTSETRIHIDNIQKAQHTLGIVEMLHSFDIEVTYEDVFLALKSHSYENTLIDNYGHVYVELHTKDKAEEATKTLHGKVADNYTLQASPGPTEFDYWEKPDIHSGRVQANSHYDQQVRWKRSEKIKATRAARVAAEAQSTEIASKVRENIASNTFMREIDDETRIRCAGVGQKAPCSREKWHIADEDLYICGQHRHQRTFLDG